MDPEWHFLFDDVMWDVEIVGEVFWADTLAFLFEFVLVEVGYEESMNGLAFEVEGSIFEG